MIPPDSPLFTEAEQLRRDLVIVLTRAWGAAELARKAGILSGACSQQEALQAITVELLATWIENRDEQISR